MSDGTSRLKRKRYEAMLAQVQEDLAHLQGWVKATGARIVIVFEGRDAAGKGGVIRRLTERVSPRVFRVVALPAPTDRERSQLYLQRYLKHFPAAGEVVVFDRSWYNRAGVERVMGFCSPDEVESFLARTPGFESYLVEQGVILRKYFLTVSEREQRRRFLQRLNDPLRQWKLSPMDIASYRHWWDYSVAYAEMLRRTDSEAAPWHVVPADDKRRARINCLAHLVGSIPWSRVPFEKPKLGSRRPKPTDFTESDNRLRIVPDVTQ